jgi:hypothetical protein
MWSVAKKMKINLVPEVRKNDFSLYVKHSVPDGDGRSAFLLCVISLAKGHEHLDITAAVNSLQRTGAVTVHSSMKGNMKKVGDSGLRDYIDAHIRIVWRGIDNYKSWGGEIADDARECPYDETRYYAFFVPEPEAPSLSFACFKISKTMKVSCVGSTPVYEITYVKQRMYITELM